MKNFFIIMSDESKGTVQSGLLFGGGCGGNTNDAGAGAADAGFGGFGVPSPGTSSTSSNWPGNPNNWAKNVAEIVAKKFGGNGGKNVPTQARVAREAFENIAALHATYWGTDNVVALYNTRERDTTYGHGGSLRDSLPVVPVRGGVTGVTNGGFSLRDSV